MIAPVSVTFPTTGTVAAALALFILLLVVSGCATRAYTPATTVEALDLQARAQTKSGDGIRVSAAVLGEEESKALFGVDLASKRIQPVWLEVQNNSTRPVWLLPTGVDPEYFSPQEVAFGFRSGFSKEARAAMGEHLDAMSFRGLVLPGSTVSGFVHTNYSRGTKVVAVDLWSTKWTNSFTLFVPVPGQEVPLPDFANLYEEVPIPNYSNEKQLRLALQRLPCCVVDERGQDVAPANLVLIGSLEDVGAALIRRGYRYTPLEPQFVFGRVQDISGVRTARWVQPHGFRLRLWLAPLHYQGRAVWLGAVYQRHGGRFAAQAETADSFDIEPEVDEALTALVMDMLYSQGLVKLGFVRRAGGSPTAVDSGEEAGNYRTNGLRAVMVFERRPVSLDELLHFDWVRPVDN